MVCIGQFLDFDKFDSLCYYNLYLEDMKMVVKTPISGELGRDKHHGIKVEKFDLVNKVFLTGF